MKFKSRLNLIKTLRLFSVIKFAICYATAKDVDLLVLRGANVNAAGENGYTSLMRAALRNDMDDDLSCLKFRTRFSYALLSPELMI